MRALRSRWGKARAVLGRGDLIESRAQHTDSGAASTSGRSFEHCQKAEQLHSSQHPNSKFPWGILAAGSCVSTGIGWTWGHFGNQAILPDHLPQIGWGMLPISIADPSNWFTRQASASRGHNFLADAAAKAMPAVVNIQHNFSSPKEMDASERTCGSGFLVDTSGIIITNAHVVDNALQRFKEDKRCQKKGPPLRVMLQNGQSYDGEVLSLDRVSDVAMIKINASSPLPAVKIGSSGGMRVGEWVLALGSPLTLQNSVTAGIVSCVGRKAVELGMSDRAMQYIQTDAAINTGNSGGPLINLAGEVVGISCMKALFSTGVSFAMPIDSAQEIIEQMKAEGRVVRPHIGIKMLQLTSENVAQMHEKDRQFPALNDGILVANVYPGSPAAKAGLKQGDIITGFGMKKEQAKVPDLVEALKQNIGRPLKLDVQRAIILGGGAGSRLYPLTKARAKPAVPIGGVYRLIDVPMSNCLNSGISKIYILTQFNSTSLNRHLARTYNFGSGVRFGGDGFVEVLAATQTPTDKEWFQGTADAVRQYAWLFEDIKNRAIQDIVILSGDHLYRMDYMKFVEHHRNTDADITIGCLPVDHERATDFGLMKINDEGQILDFAEKPKGEALEKMKVDTTILGLSAAEAQSKPFIASMGIYVFKKDQLVKLLKETYIQSNDFGGEIIPAAAADHKVVAYLFNDYWEDIGTIKSFFEANLALAQHPPQFEFYDPQTPIYTSPRFLPPAKIVGCKVNDVIISHGSFLEECTVENAIIGLRSRIGKGVVIQDAMIMGADYYESEEQRQKLFDAGRLPIGIGAGSVISNTIVDKNARIGQNCQIVNKDGIEEANKESEGFYIRSGIVTVLRNAEVPNGTVL